MDPHERIIRGQEAAILFESAAFQLAMKTIDAQIKRDWSMSSIEDAALRERLWLKQSLLQNLVSELISTAADGKLEEDAQGSPVG